MGIVKYTLDGHVKASDLDKILTEIHEYYEERFKELDCLYSEVQELKKQVKDLEADKVLRDDIKRFTATEN